MSIRDLIWTGSTFDTVDADTVDGFHADAFGNLYKNVFMTGHGGFQFTAENDVTSFVIPTDIYNPTTDTAQFYFEGLRLNEVENFTLSKNTVSLTFTLKKGESIFVKITHSSYNYEELSNKPRIGSLADLQTSNKTTLVEAINEVYDLAKAGGGNGGSFDVGFAPYTGTRYRFVATKPTSEIEIKEDIYEKKVVVYQLGIRLFEDKEYEIVGGDIRLALPLEAGEHIDYVVIKLNMDMPVEEVHVRYNATSNVDSFNIVEDAVDKELKVYMLGARLFKDLDYKVEGNKITLNKPLESGEFIDYTYLKEDTQAISDLETKLNDLRLRLDAYEDKL